MSARSPTETHSHSSDGRDCFARERFAVTVERNTHGPTNNATASDRLRFDYAVATKMRSHIMTVTAYRLTEVSNGGVTRSFRKLTATWRPITWSTTG